MRAVFSLLGSEDSNPFILVIVLMSLKGIRWFSIVFVLLERHFLDDPRYVHPHVITHCILTHLQGSNLNSDTSVSQLTMVPLQDTHPAQGVIEPDRMLMMTGALVDSNYGNASTVLFDGQAFIPYIVSTMSNGHTGFVASLFHSFAKITFAQRSACFFNCSGYFHVLISF